MKPESQFSFEISGEIFRTESKLDNYYDDKYYDDKYYDDKYYDDKELLSILSDKENYIRKEIEDKLYYYASEFGKVERIDVQLRFERGSILATGWVIIQFLGGVSGAISFFEYFNGLINFIRRTIQRAISNNLPGNRNSYRVSINIIPENYPSPASNNSYDNNALDLFKISPSKLLLSITLINIMLFIGGTLFTTIEVPSILEKYDEAEAKVKAAKDQYQSNQQEIENIKKVVLQKKEAVLNSLSTDTIQIKTDITNIDKKLTMLSSQIKELNQNKDRYEESLKELNESIAKLQENKATFNFLEVWQYMNLWLKTIVVIVLLVTTLTIVYSLIYITRNNKTR